MEEVLSPLLILGGGYILHYLSFPNADEGGDSPQGEGDRRPLLRSGIGITW